MRYPGFNRAALAMTVAALLPGAWPAAQAQAQPQVTAAPLQVYAAGSLREPLSEIAHIYEAATGVRAVLTFGASGLLRARIEQGEPAQVFASADTGHPQALARRGDWQPAAVFARNTLCALTTPQESATPASLLNRLLDPGVRLGTSTPGADPSGDYAWALFRRADALLPGAYAVLDAKALRLTGAAGTPKSPAGRGTYAWLMEECRADIFLTYCTNALSAQKEVPGLRVVALPGNLQVGAAYGLSAKSGDAAALGFANFLLQPQAQALLAKAGFAAP